MLRQQSIKCASLAATAVSQVYYDNWHKRFSADFPRRVLLFEEALLWSVTKPQIMTLFYLTRLVSVSSKQELQTSDLVQSEQLPYPFNKTLLVFADVFAVNAHHTQTGQAFIWHCLSKPQLPSLPSTKPRVSNAFGAVPLWVIFMHLDVTRTRQFCT